MRYALASLFTLLIIGAASAVPDEQAIMAVRPTAALARDCDVAAESVSGSAEHWDELRPPPRNGATPNAETLAGVNAALREFVACLNDRPGLVPGPNPGSGRRALVWVGEPWLLPDARVAAPVITRRGAGAEVWSVVILTPRGNQFVVAAAATLDAQGGPPSTFPSAQPSGSVAPG